MFPDVTDRVDNARMLDGTFDGPNGAKRRRVAVEDNMADRNVAGPTPVSRPNEQTQVHAGAADDTAESRRRAKTTRCTPLVKGQRLLTDFLSPNARS